MFSISQFVFLSYVSFKILLYLLFTNFAFQPSYKIYKTTYHRKNIRLFWMNLPLPMRFILSYISLLVISTLWFSLKGIPLPLQGPSSGAELHQVLLVWKAFPLSFHSEGQCSQRQYSCWASFFFHHFEYIVPLPLTYSFCWKISLWS